MEVRFAATGITATLDVTTFAVMTDEYAVSAGVCEAWDVLLENGTMLVDGTDGCVVDAFEILEVISMPVDRPISDAAVYKEIDPAVEICCSILLEVLFQYGKLPDGAYE